MSRQLGRISGPLLTANLLREGNDLRFENNLLYLDVTNNKISIKDSPTNKELFVNNSILSKDLIVDNLLAIADIEVRAPNTIKSTLGPLNLVATNGVNTNNIQTDDIDITGNIISTLTADTNVELRPTGTTEIFANTNVTGSVHATGNITAGGNVVFGNTNTDAVTFFSDIKSDIIPDVTDIYNLGSPTRRWAEFNVTNLIVDNTAAGDLLTPGGVNPILRPGKSWFVSPVSGLDTNVGDHENGPFRTIAKALTLATSGDCVHLYPGEYVEVFPLTVPVGVTIKGISLRSVTIKPTLATNTNDAFLLNGETTVVEVTVSDFYYNAVNNTGYAFRFAPGMKVTTRSPYVQNCSVITRGSVITTDDPLGFDQGDAGKGALVDGSVADVTTKEASMLFHSCTFIVPGVDALTMTNGVRVEWLNSFTYFADKSLYAINGTLGLANQGVRFGAEVRSIASASVYGNYGAWADGADTLMYLIQYNFAYIGSGKDSSNDSTLVSQVDEVVRLNNGKIYYQSHNKGMWRAGDAFFVNLEKGITSINVSEGNVTGLSSLTINTGTEQTYIDSSKIETGNFVLRDNTILTTTGPFNIVSADGEIYLNENILIEKDLNITGSIGIDGVLILGNQVIDTVGFAADVDSDIIPQITGTYSIGDTDRRWKETYLRIADIGDITISNNRIIPSIEDSNLVLSANGTGIIYIPVNDVTIVNTLTVNVLTTSKNLEVSSNTLHQGDYLLTGDAFRIGNTNITGNVTVSNVVQFSDIEIDDNQITTTIGNNDLRLVSNGTKLYVPDNNVEIDNNLTVLGTTSLASIEITNTVEADQFTTGDILIDDNYITTTELDSNLELLANGTGKILVPTKNVEITQQLAVNDKTTVKNVNITGDTDHSGDYLQLGNVGRTGDTDITGYIDVSGSSQFEKIRIATNVLSNTITNEDLRLVANGTGLVLIDQNNVVINNNLTVLGVTDLEDISVTQTITANAFTTGDVFIDDNYITTTVTNSNLELRADGTGKILVPLKNVEIVEDLTVNAVTSLRATVLAGLLTQTGNRNQEGNYVQTGSTTISGTLDVDVDALFPRVQFVDKRISATFTNEDLRLAAAGTGRLYVPSDNVRFDQTLTVIGTTDTVDINSSGTITANQFTTGDIVIDDNYAITTVGNNNLILTANGTGYVRFEKLLVTNNTVSTENNETITVTPGTGMSLLIDSVTALKIPAGTTAARPVSLTGDFRFSTTDSLFGGWSSARRTFGGVYSADRLSYARAHPTNNTIAFVAGSVATMDVLTDKLRLNGLQVSDKFFLNNNIIQNTVSNADLTLLPSSGTTTINSISINENQWTNNLDTPLAISHTGDGYLKFTGTYGIVITTGTDEEKPLAPEIGMTRFNSDLQYMEIYDGTKWIPIIGEVETATLSEIVEIGDLWTLILG